MDVKSRLVQLTIELDPGEDQEVVVGRVVARLQYSVIVMVIITVMVVSELNRGDAGSSDVWRTHLKCR